MKIYLLKLAGKTDEIKSIYTRLQHITIKKISIDAKDHWQQLINIIENAERAQENSVIFCTNEKLLEKLNVDNFSRQIKEAAKYNAKILLANAGNAVSLLPISSNLFWIDHFTGCELMVIFRSCYALLTNEEHMEDEMIDEKLSEITSNKLLVHPMISDHESPINSRTLTMRMDRLMNQKKVLDNFAKPIP